MFRCGIHGAFSCQKKEICHRRRAGSGVQSDGEAVDSGVDFDGSDRLFKDVSVCALSDGYIGRGGHRAGGRLYRISGDGEDPEKVWGC